MQLGMCRRAILLLLCLLAVAGCAPNQSLLELRATVMYDKPQIREITHTLAETPEAGAPVVVEVTLVGDPGLAATFDITPGITAKQPMREVEDGVYKASFSFAPDVFGGPYWVTGRLRHERAGEQVVRDATPFMIALPGR